MQIFASSHGGLLKKTAINFAHQFARPSRFKDSIPTKDEGFDHDQQIRGSQFFFVTHLKEHMPKM